ncbi:hypothetical protein ACM55F_09925 [Flavobacterium sp. XS2P12]|uniref:hypothetical protein n=1 Tax=Flavobacterium melibiosi TaxID=3398734 RepID=UPI003A88AE2A
MKALKTEKTSHGVVIKTYPGTVQTNKIKTGEYTLTIKGVGYPAIFKTEEAALFASKIKYEILRDIFKTFDRKYLDIKLLKEVYRFSKK